MAMGGFDQLTLEQQGKCMLLGIGVARHNQNGWWIYREGPPLQIMCKNDKPVLFNSVDEAIAEVTRQVSSYQWL